MRIHAGTIVEAAPNPQARVPAYVLRIDFGPLGMRTSSAQRHPALHAAGSLGDRS